MIIHTYERSGRGEACAELLNKCSAAGCFQSIIILPIPTTKDGRTLNGTDIPLDAVPPLAGKNSLVVGYGIPGSLREELTRIGACVCDSLQDEQFLQDNAELTALATVGILLTSSDRSPSDQNIGIVGYGRIGRRLTRMLLCLGARVRVFTSRNGTRMLLCEAGVSSGISGVAEGLEDIDVLINTAPAVIFDTSSEKTFPPDIRVIDLASGENFPGLSGVERYPSVPARMFPYSSGKAWFGSVERFLFGGRKFDGENV